VSTEARVASMLNRRELAFNAGSDHGVRSGDIATVIRETEIKDPETGESLGRVRRASVRLRIYEVQPKLSVGRTYESAQPGTSGTYGLTLAALAPDTVQLTTTEGDQDYRTILVKRGDEVIIEHEAKEETAETQQEAS
jgi:Flagellar assembly protein T, C-terminal domain